MQSIKEIWRPVVGYEGYYEVSNTNLYRSIPVYGRGRKNNYKILKLEKKTSKDGTIRYYASFCVDGKRHRQSFARVVALAFPEICGEHFEGADANHIDENPENNTPENINWLCRKDNINFGTRNKRASETKRNGALSQPINMYDKCGNYIKRFPSAEEAGRYLNKDSSHISECANGKRKSAYEHIFKWC